MPVRLVIWVVNHLQSFLSCLLGVLSRISTCWLTFTIVCLFAAAFAKGTKRMFAWQAHYTYYNELATAKLTGPISDNDHMSQPPNVSPPSVSMVVPAPYTSTLCVSSSDITQRCDSNNCVAILWSLPRILAIAWIHSCKVCQ